MSTQTAHIYGTAADPNTKRAISLAVAAGYPYVLHDISKRDAEGALSSLVELHATRLTTIPQVWMTSREEKGLATNGRLVGGLEAMEAWCQPIIDQGRPVSAA